MKTLPIGISTLEEIINKDHAYVDKTPYIQALINNGNYYFISRPRRFGKSLLLDTLHQLFAGNEALFRELSIHPHWDWSIKYPVIRLSFGGGVLKNDAELRESCYHQLNTVQQLLNIDIPHSDYLPGYFADLIRHTVQQYGEKVVILVDEYDKPILDNIANDGIAADMRNGLRNLYSVIKDNDANIRFAFLTGVSKFSKVSVFSGLNNIEDITLDARYSAICGYTQDELEHTFAKHLEGADMALVRKWYNGYRWLGESVYNPFDILLFIAKGKEFLPHWFETATPTFLLELLQRRYFYLPDFENLRVNHQTLGDFDVGRLRLETLLFQTGYLTIKERTIAFPGSLPEYVLSYPNQEVRLSLNSYLLDNYLTDNIQEKHSVYQAFLHNDFDALEQRLRQLFAEIPYQNHTNNQLADYEGFYASVMYAFLCSLGMDTRTEESNNKGRIDMALRFTLPDGQQQAYIFEFKVVEGETAGGSALKQIKDKDYAAAYRDGQTRIFLIGIEFSKKLRGIVRFEWEEDSPPQ